MCLAATLKQRVILGPDDWIKLVKFFPRVADLIRSDRDLSSIWLPVWEQRTKMRLEQAFDAVEKECLADIETVAKLLTGEPASAYQRFVESLGGLTEECRGSGIKTAIIASALCWIFREKDDPTEPLVTAANLLHSDTDTIATMAGAILGVVTDGVPVNQILDREYIVQEATRLHRIRSKQPAESFTYPDLIRWQPPKTQLDAFGSAKDTCGLSGLGFVKSSGKSFGASAKNTLWQKITLDFGQTVVCKRRKNLKPLPTTNIPLKPTPPRSGAESTGLRESIGIPKQEYQSNLFPSPADGTDTARDKRRRKAIHELTDQVIQSNFDTALIGSHLLELAEGGKGAIEQAVAYAAIVAKARIARLEARRNIKSGNS